MSDEFELNSVPTRPEIMLKIKTLKPIFLEGYRRSIAAERFPAADFILKSADEVAGEADSGRFGEHHGVWEVLVDEHGRDERLVSGWYQWSETLGFYVPVGDPGHEGEYSTRDRASLEHYWHPSTPGDEESIDAEAQTRTSTSLGDIEDAFEEVIEQCPVWKVRALLPHLNRLARGIDDLYQVHDAGGGEFDQVEQLWDEWDGRDAQACYELFGSRLRSAASAHREMVAVLNGHASQEGVRQASAVTQLHNGIATAHQNINESLATEDRDSPFARFVGKILVNRVPFVSDGMNTTDYVLEISSDGKETGKTGGWLDSAINWLVDKANPTYARVPTAELCDETRDDLVQLADEVLNEVTAGRNAEPSGPKLADSAEHWRNVYNADDCSLIPGYRQ